MRDVMIEPGWTAAAAVRLRRLVAVRRAIWSLGRPVAVAMNHVMAFVSDPSCWTVGTRPPVVGAVPRTRRPKRMARDSRDATMAWVDLQRWVTCRKRCAAAIGEASDSSSSLELRKCLCCARSPQRNQLLRTPEFKEAAGVSRNFDHHVRGVRRQPEARDRVLHGLHRYERDIDEATRGPL